MQHDLKKNILSALISSTLIFSASAHAEKAISLFNSKYIISSSIPMQKVESLVASQFDVAQYRNIKVQVISNASHAPDHILVYLFSKKYHRVDVARINIDPQYNFKSLIQPYHLNADDFNQQAGISASEAKCPSAATGVQVIAFAPNDYELEQDVTKQVADAAEFDGFSTKRLLLKDASHDNYLNYMACPNLIGNFYDGDANTDLITTADGVINYSEIQDLLQFKYKTVNIWLACEAFNDPMKKTMLSSAQSQKYAAGINDLAVGPSDLAAGCAFAAAMNGQPMSDAFKSCYALLDTPTDQWGFDGDGKDYFGK